MTGKCKLEECGAPSVPCHLGCEDYNTCENFVAEVVEKKIKKEKVAEVKSQV